MLAGCARDEQCGLVAIRSVALGKAGGYLEETSRILYSRLRARVHLAAIEEVRLLQLGAQAREWPSKVNVGDR